MSSLIVPPRRGFFGGGYPNLLTVKIIPIRTTVLGNGQNDLYTVPTGKRASISYTVTNESGGAINHTFQIKISGTYYTFVATASVINNTTGIQSNALNTCPIAEAGETFSILTNAANLVLSGFIVEFSASEAIKSPKILSLINGDNTVYTCPVNKKAFIGNYLGGNAGIVKYGNFSGSNRAIHWNVVKSGGTPSAAINQTTANITAIVTNTINNQQAMYAALTAGDFVSINSDASTATQIAWIENLIELPA